jgi:uncharacterized protein involved in response to NO
MSGPLLHFAPPSSPPSGLPLLRLGFRPFYLCAAIFACLAIPFWLAQAQGLISPGRGLSGMAWHAHEMLYGYAIAVIAGFLLTAVPNWSGQPTPSGRPLALLLMLWLSARLLLPFVPLWLAAGLDLLFLPTLAWVLRRSLRGGNNRRNDFIPRLLLALASLNLVFYLAQTGWLNINPLRPLEATLGLITVLEVIIAGRVLPMFTRNAVPQVRQQRFEWLERWIALSTLVVMMANLLPLTGWLLAPANGLLALAHLKRWLGWDPLACWRKPLLWVLHAGYLCVVLGLLLAAGAALGWLSWVAVHHMFAVGALGCLTLGMITRTALGHSGRPLETSNYEALAYAAMLLACCSRVLPLLVPLAGSYFSWMWLAGFFWCTAFILYLLRYVPILIKARVDGKPG